MKNVLIVDDNAVVRRHLRGLLERDGCLVCEATDGAQALELAGSRSFDMMFLEAMGPDLDAASVMAALAQKKRAIPTVLTSASESSTQMVSAFKLGAKDFLLKPYREAQIHRALRQATGLDFATIQRTRTDLAVLDRDEDLAQTLRTLAGDLDTVDQAEDEDHAQMVLPRGHQLVFIGAVGGAAEDEEEAAEALGDLASQLDPRALLVRLLSETTAPPAELTVFHAAVPRTDQGLARVVTAVRSGAALTAGRLVRALRYEGPPELLHLYWWTLKNSVHAALTQLLTVVKAPPSWRGWAGRAPGWGASITLDLSLAPDDEAQLGALVDGAVSFARSRMVELAVLRERSSHTPAPQPGAAAVAPEGLAAEAPAEDLVTVAGVELGALLGLGRGWQTYAGTQKSLKRKVCVKVLRAALCEEPGLVQRFQDDGVALAAVRHPHLVSVLDVGHTEQGRPYLMTEFVEGGDLRAFAATHARVPPAVAIDLVSQLLLGLAEAHGNDLVHRDLKPSNVLLGTRKDGRTVVKLVDFGLSGLAVGSLQAPEAAGVSGPTSSYLSPEQMLGMEATFASDLYATGVILFELLTGALPFVARDDLELVQLTMMSPAPRLRELLGDGVPEALDALVDALLAKMPRARPQGAQEVRDALLAIPLAVAPVLRVAPG